MTSRPGIPVDGESRTEPGPDDATDGPSAVLQEAIDATAVAYAGDASLDAEQSLRTEMASRGIDQVDDAWISDVAEKTLKDARSSWASTMGPLMRTRHRARCPTAVRASPRLAKPNHVRPLSPARAHLSSMDGYGGGPDERS
jgi:hypothetical protein